jgi:hypothetical protein
VARATSIKAPSHHPARRTALDRCPDGAPDPALLASQLQLIYDGGGLAAKMDRSPASPPPRAAASALIAAALTR